MVALGILDTSMDNAHRMECLQNLTQSLMFDYEVYNSFGVVASQSYYIM